MASSSPSAPARRSAAREGVARLMRTPAKIMVPRLLFIVAVVLLCVVGLVVVYSASSVQAYSDTGDPALYVRRQALYLLVGALFCLLFACVPYRFWSHPLLFGGLWVLTTLLLVATQIGFGTQALGAERSIVIAGVAIQPAEFAKITTVFAVCCLLVMYREGRLELRRFAVALAVAIAVPILFIFRQPDLGTVIILFVGLLAAAVLAGLSWKVVLAGLALIAAYAVFVCIVQPYHLERLKTLIDPWSDPSDTGYQTIQSLYALALGGVDGAGLGLSQEKYLYLPYAHTDFIFAVIGEEFGLVGTISIVLLFALFTYAGIRICRNAPDLLGCTLAGSLTVMVAFQACVNMGCVVGLLPVTGKALPFLSYGGSSLVATLAMVGLVLSVSFASRVNVQSEKRRAALHVVGSDSHGEGGAGLRAHAGNETGAGRKAHTGRAAHTGRGAGAGRASHPAQPARPSHGRAHAPGTTHAPGKTHAPGTTRPSGQAHRGSQRPGQGRRADSRSEARGTSHSGQGRRADPRPGGGRRDDPRPGGGYSRKGR